jgi:hypothetical protein
VTTFALGSGLGAVATTGPILLGARGLQGLTRIGRRVVNRRENSA